MLACRTLRIRTIFAGIIGGYIDLSNREDNNDWGRNVPFMAIRPPQKVSFVVAGKNNIDLNTYPADLIPQLFQQKQTCSIWSAGSASGNCGFLPSDSCPPILVQREKRLKDTHFSSYLAQAARITD